MLRIRKNDTVIVTTGRDKGKTGRVLRVIEEKDSVIVEQANLRKKHEKPNQNNKTGGIVDKEAPIHISNVMLVDAKTGKGTRYKISKNKDNAKVRVATKTATVFD